jgi:hypothetical protein
MGWALMQARSSRLARKDPGPDLEQCRKHRSVRRRIAQRNPLLASRSYARQFDRLSRSYDNGRKEYCEFNSGSNEEDAPASRFELKVKLLGMKLGSCQLYNAFQIGLEQACTSIGGFEMHRGDAVTRRLCPMVVRRYGNTGAAQEYVIV